MKDREAEFQARKNLPPRWRSCGAPFVAVKEEDRIAAIGEYGCGARFMAFRDPRKTACVRLCTGAPAKPEAKEKDQRIGLFLV